MMNQLKEQLGNLFTELGYGAIGNAIKNDDQGKENALYGLSMWERSAKSPRWNLVNGEMKKVWEPDQEHLNKIDGQKAQINKFIKLIYDTDIVVID